MSISYFWEKFTDIKYEAKIQKDGFGRFWLLIILIIISNGIAIAF